ncbi:hypothetical protein GIB67_011530 [Kingdonia uniflora]|uniref:starch synthase n=1 Tax=Kingdonia uniflora TaxID=39325 RepID=A0A7J7NLS4_9MAGN|nr:hypothetical protein GIB67_011530 [Kingdonia uniflora]
MEVNLQTQAPLFCRRAFLERTHLKITPRFASFSHGRSSHSSLWSKEYNTIGVSFRIVANADDSRRKPRKSSSTRPKGHASKELMLKTTMGKYMRKKDRIQTNNAEKDNLSSSSSTIRKTDTSEEQEIKLSPVISENDENVEVEKTILTSKHSAMVMKDGVEGDQRFIGINEDLLAESEAEDNVDESIVARKWADVIDSDVSVESETQDETDEDVSDSEYTKSELEIDAQLYKLELEDLADENFVRGNKIFVCPKLVKPNQEIEVFLNKSISPLKGESDVFIMGAFNDWKWKSFTKKLSKTELKGDWWSCRLHVPNEAYKIDFVFFNGGIVYENNDMNDFMVPVKGGLSLSAFEDFLLEEKRGELERLAAEEAEKKRQANEQRRIEEEKAATEANRAQARAEIVRRRELILSVMKKATRSSENVWSIEPSDFKDGELVRLYYNRSSGPLARSKELWIHGGYNNWKDELSFVGKLFPSLKRDGDWFHAHVLVPHGSLVLDWVIADGPPESATSYDNNKLEDFHAIVPKSLPEERYWVEKEQHIFIELEKQRKLREEALRIKAKKTAQMKAETKRKTVETYLLAQKHVVYTEPLDVQAGSIVTVLYNPSNTVLNGKPEVWFRCSFNHWTHRSGTLPPQRMLPADGGSHLKATVKVPLDAYSMDFVFSEKEDGGIFDNKSGMDYHIPVFGGVAKEPPMHIVHVAIEMAPIAKADFDIDQVESMDMGIL